MRRLKSVLAGLVILSLVIATAVFVLENRQPVALVFFGWSAPELSIAVPVILALLLGMLIGPVLAWFATLRKRPRGPAAKF
ncbi:LapA family protein [Pseudomonas sp. DTU_2021_1001937_2_SI_NGA_ILE_001]|uniref:LapA family protein n=1 Tax=Pseudomonas sp. DTU_2021_1001937_2_SI_NGA_ILE_001 TaxID=3077589 RepID=UPI0025CF868B|nr:LapA family protein [Pseudomonas sp. DTU_2021_1001937_2_SI_NGA_ILE_001]WNW13819.1 LapA family protein [Pseudomonas sp. DTU_2021_1001937_2_SI_NGA_ILE_001]